MNEKELLNILHSSPVTSDTRLFFCKRADYIVNLVNHLGEIISTHHEWGGEKIVAEVLSDGDIYQAMCNPRISMRTFFDDKKNEIAGRLFDLSLTHSIEKIEWNTSTQFEMRYTEPQTSFEITFIETAQTNITADVIEAILQLIEGKYGYWERVLHNCARKEWY